MHMLGLIVIFAQIDVQTDKLCRTTTSSLNKSKQGYCNNLSAKTNHGLLSNQKGGKIFVGLTEQMSNDQLFVRRGRVHV